MKILKFYKEDCVPCHMLTKMLAEFKDIEIIPIDVKKEYNTGYNITGVPTLIKETGERLVGLKSKQELNKFIYGEA